MPVFARGHRHTRFSPLGNGQFARLIKIGQRVFGRAVMIFLQMGGQKRASSMPVSNTKYGIYIIMNC